MLGSQARLVEECPYSLYLRKKLSTTSSRNFVPPNKIVIIYHKDDMPCILFLIKSIEVTSSKAAINFALRGDTLEGQKRDYT